MQQMEVTTMRIQLTKIIPGALLLAGMSALPAVAQYGDPYYRQPAAAPAQDGLFDRVQRDLDRTAANPYLKAGARGHLDHARQEVWRFQQRWASGRFDMGDLDGAIKAVNKVVNADSVDYHDRQTLQDDLFRMRDFRAQRGYAAAFR
jgi:hypothetical protein